MTPGQEILPGAVEVAAALRVALETSADYCALCSVDGNLDWANGSWRAAFGPVTGTSVYAHVVADSVNSLKRLMERAAVGDGDRVELEWLVAGGHRRLDMSACLCAPGLILLCAHDVSDHARLRHSNRLAERTARLMGELVGIGTWRVDLNKKVVEADSAAGAAFGWAPGTASMSWHSFVDCFAPDSVPMVQQALSTALGSGGGFGGEWRLHKPARPGAGPGVRVEARVLLDGLGAPDWLYGITLPQAERVETPTPASALCLQGGLISSVIHEINNPLSAVTGHLEITWSDLADERAGYPTAPLEERIESVDLAREAAQRVRDLLDGFRSLATDGGFPKEVSELSATVQMGVDLAKAAVARRAELSFDPVAVGGVLASETAVLRCVVNALLWATRFKGEPPHLAGLRPPRTGGEGRRYNVDVSLPELAASHRQVVISSSGDGPLDDTVSSALRFQADAPGEGLALARATLAELGGRLEWSTEPGRHTVTLHFPRSAVSSRTQTMPSVERPS